VQWLRLFIPFHGMNADDTCFLPWTSTPQRVRTVRVEWVVEWVVEWLVVMVVVMVAVGG